MTVGVAGEVQVLDEQFSQDDIKGRLSIEIEDEVNLCEVFSNCVKLTQVVLNSASKR